MDTLEIVVIAVVAVFALLALAGAAAARRRREAGAEAFTREIEQANRDLAAAHAADNGWEPGRVAEAARSAFTQERPGVEVASIELVQVIDPPGTEDDKAVFLVRTADGEHHLTLGRAGDSWHLESLA
jgi:Flp pilus assembly protein TadB